MGVDGQSHEVAQPCLALPSIGGTPRVSYPSVEKYFNIMPKVIKVIILIVAIKYIVIEYLESNTPVCSKDLLDVPL